MKIMDHKLNNLKQVVVEAVDDRGAILTDAISAGASSDLTKDFTTVLNNLTMCRFSSVTLIFDLGCLLSRWQAKME